MEEALRIFELHDHYHDQTFDDADYEEFGRLILSFTKLHARHFASLRSATTHTDPSWPASYVFEAMIKNRRVLKTHNENTARAYLLLMIKRLYLNAIKKQQTENKHLESSTMEDGTQRETSDMRAHLIHQDEQEAHERAITLTRAIALVREHILPTLGRADFARAAHERFDQQLKRSLDGLSSEQILDLQDDLDAKTRKAKINVLNKNLERLRVKLSERYEEERRARALGSADRLSISDEDLEIIGELFKAFRGESAQELSAARQRAPL